MQPAGLRYSLNVATFQVALDNALKNVVAGYVAQLRQSGRSCSPTHGNTPNVRKMQRAVEPDVQMHVASVSKLMTAMAMTVLFRDNNISPDAKIIDYLPNYWEKGSNIE